MLQRDVKPMPTAHFSAGVLFTIRSFGDVHAQESPSLLRGFQEILCTISLSSGPCPSSLFGHMTPPCSAHRSLTTSQSPAGLVQSISWKPLTVRVDSDTYNLLRDLFKIVWRRKSRTSRREPRIPQETIDLIKKMAAENTWGAERIRGELLKLGIPVSKRTVQRHMRGVRDPKKPPQDWKTFLKNHAKDVWACDFIQVFDAFFRPIFAFFIVEHESRRVVHFNVASVAPVALPASDLQ